MEHEILRTLAGSTVHGLAVGDTDDRDEMGVYVPPMEEYVSLNQIHDSYTARTQPDGARSGPGDVDLMMYSLRKFVSLVVAGNPTMLTPLFAPDNAMITVSGVGKQVREQASHLLSRQAGHRFLGYLHGQKERILGGGKQNRVPNRPELVERYGYDTKYAGHALRLAVQGVELLRTGHLTLPMEDPWRTTILGVRTGQYGLDEVLRMVDKEAVTLVDLANGTTASALPEHVNLNVVNNLLYYWHEQEWGW